MSAAQGGITRKPHPNHMNLQYGELVIITLHLPQSIKLISPQNREKVWNKGTKEESGREVIQSIIQGGLEDLVQDQPKKSYL